MDDELESKITQIVGLLKNQFGGSENGEEPKESPLDGDTLQMMMKMKRVMEQQNRKDDPAKNLLLAIKPFLKESRRTRVNHCIQFLSLSQVAQYSDLFQTK